MVDGELGDDDLPRRLSSEVDGWVVVVVARSPLSKTLVAVPLNPSSGVDGWAVEPLNKSSVVDSCVAVPLNPSSPGGDDPKAPRSNGGSCKGCVDASNH